MNVSKECGNVKCEQRELCHRYKYGELNKYVPKEGKCSKFISHINFLTKNV